MSEDMARRQELLRGSGQVRRDMPLGKYMRLNWVLYIMLIPGLINLLLFKYLPMYGIVVAFQDYTPKGGFFGSKWVGLKHFAAFFRDPFCWRVISNTIILGLESLIFSFPAPILLALLLNELRFDRYKKVSQTILYLPHFLSWVISGGLVTTLFATTSGLINKGLTSIGLPAVPWLSDNGWWIFMYVFVTVWQGIGWGAIVYLSAITGIDQEMYEAAKVDGCSRFKMMTKITLPSIRTTIVIMLILRVGGMMSIGFEKPQMLKNVMVNEVGDVISTFIYRYGIENNKFAISTAGGLLQSVINFALVMTANSLSRKISDESIW